MPSRTASRIRNTRQRAGKSEKARINVRAYHRGNHIFIEVEDDGRGIDYDGVRRRVVEMGAMSPVAAAELTDRELREFLFRPGFTTASSMTELAGRGVGLDVVRANVHALNGEIEVRTEPGRGACFTVKVPLTLIISQALFVRCGTSVFALPLAVVEEIRRLQARRNRRRRRKTAHPRARRRHRSRAARRAAGPSAARTD